MDYKIENEGWIVLFWNEVPDRMRVFVVPIAEIPQEINQTVLFRNLETVNGHLVNGVFYGRGKREEYIEEGLDYINTLLSEPKYANHNWPSPENLPIMGLLLPFEKKIEESLYFYGTIFSSDGASVSIYNSGFIL